MPVSFEFTITVLPEGTPELVRGSFDDPEALRLRRFRELAAVLRACDAFQSNDNAHMTLSSKDGEHSFSTSYSKAERVEVVHRLRPLMREEDENSFQRVSGILGRRVIHEGFRNWLKSIGERFRAPVSGLGVATKDESGAIVPVGTPEMLNKWLNAYDYHADEEKRQEFERLTQVVPQAHLEFVVFDMLIMRVSTITLLAWVIGSILTGAEITLEDGSVRDAHPDSSG